MLAPLSKGRAGEGSLRRMKSFLIILLIFSLHLPSFSQDQHKIDSLLACLKTAKHDTAKVEIFYQLAGVHCGNDTTRAIDYASRCRALSEKIGYRKGVGKYYNMMGSIKWFQGNYIQALEFYKKFLSVSEELIDQPGTATAYGNIGSAYIAIGNYPEGLKNNIAALKIREKIGDKGGIARSYLAVGIINHEQHNYPAAVKYLILIFLRVIFNN